MRWPRWVALLAVNLLAAVCYVGIKVGLAYAPSLAFGGLRALIAGVVLLAVAASLRTPLWPSSRDVWPLTLLALAATTLTYGAMFSSPAQMGAGLASVLGNVQPLLVLVLGALFLREPLTPGKVVALACGLIGVGFLLYPSIAALPGSTGMSAPTGGSMTIGSLLALGASAGAAAGSVLVKRIRVRPGIIALTGWQLVIGSLPLLVAAGLRPNGLAIQWQPTFVAVLLYLALLGTALPTTLWFWLLQAEDAGRLSMFLFLIPVLGLLLGVVVFGERTGWLEATGVAIIVSGLVAVSRERRRSSDIAPGLRRQAMS